MSKIDDMLEGLGQTVDELDERLIQIITNIVRVLGNIKFECQGYRVLDKHGKLQILADITYKEGEGVILSMYESDEPEPEDATFQAVLNAGFNIPGLLSVITGIVARMQDDEIEERIEKFIQFSALQELKIKYTDEYEQHYLQYKECVGAMFKS